MNLVEWTDAEGTPHLSWLPDGADDPEMGIPHDPPDTGKLDMPDEQKRAIYAALVKHQIVTWRGNDQLLRETIAKAIRDIPGLIPTPALAGQVATLYADRKVVLPLTTRFNLDRALSNFDVTDEQLACIREQFAAAKIETLAELEEAPARTGHICGVDIYQLTAHILAWA